MIHAGITIERATVDTSRLAARLLHAQLAEHQIASSEDFTRTAIDGLLRDAARGFVLIARNREVVGLAVVAFAWAVEHGGQVAWLDELYVVPHLRGGGIGQALLLEVIAESGRQGCVAVELEVDREHVRAANLYEREGFKPLPRARFVRNLERTPDESGAE